MTDLPTVPPDVMLPAPFEFGVSPDPDFPPRPLTSEGDDFPDVPTSRVQLPTRQSLRFAAAPIPLDYAPQAPDFTVPSRAAGLVLSADSNPATPPRPAGRQAPAPAADPSLVWDLAATDVFPAAADPSPRPEAPSAVPGDDDPGASSR